jgi:hypothetical protein
MSMMVRFISFTSQSGFIAIEGFLNIQAVSHPDIVQDVDGRLF